MCDECGRAKEMSIASIASIATMNQAGWVVTGCHQHPSTSYFPRNIGNIGNNWEHQFDFQYESQLG